MNTKSPQVTLSQTLGIKLTKTLEGSKALIAFHKKYPEETRLVLDEDKVCFDTDDSSFELHADLSANLETVFKIIGITYCPTTIVFDSGWVKSVDEAVSLLADWDGSI